MKITSKEQAFKLLENAFVYFPYDAIEYLYEQPRAVDIDEKIIFHLKNANNHNLYSNSVTKEYNEMPLWYAIVAENHLSESLVDPIIELFKSDQDGDFLLEQCMYLVSRCCAEFGEPVIEKFFSAFENYKYDGSSNSVLFLHECLHYVNQEKYLSRVLALLDNDYYWKDALICTLGEIKFMGISPKLHEIKKLYSTSLQKNDAKYLLGEIDEAIKLNENNDEPNGSYLEERKPWRQHYNHLETVIEKHRLENTKLEIPKKKKLGRNDSCHCGSGKKYKKCCLI